MARNFSDVCRKIEEIAPEALKRKLRGSYAWAPEIAWHNLTDYVNMCVAPCSTDETSVKIYALLCDRSEDEIKAMFQAEGF